MPGKLLIIGISGVTCGGKTTIACELNKILPNSNMVSQDDYFFNADDPRHVWIPELNHINYDILSSLDMEKMNQDIKNFIRDTELVKTTQNTHKTFNIQNSSRDLKLLLHKTDLQVLIIEGFTIFNYKPMRSLFHLKYYFTLQEEECFRRRMQRVYEPPDCPGYFEMCVWPEYLKQLEEIQRDVQDVKYFNERSNNALEEILNDIVKYSKA